MHINKYIIALILGAVLFSAERWIEGTIVSGLWDRRLTIVDQAVKCAVKVLDGISCDTDSDCIEKHIQATHRCIDGET